MELIKITTVVIPEGRQRKKFTADTLSKLAASIARLGLLHPIVLNNPEERRLCAGERRLRAIASLSTPFICDGVECAPGWVPVTYKRELPPEQLFEVELEENIQRENLTWQERVDAEAKLHNFRAGQRAAVGEKQLYLDTAREIHGDTWNANDQMSVRNATVLQPLLSDPDVAKAKNEKEAMAIARRKLTQMFTSKLAENFDAAKATATDHTLRNGDCRIELAALADASIDVIIVDPPYGINADKMAPLSGSNSGAQHEYVDSVENAETIWEAIFRHGYRVTKPEAHLYMFCDFRHWQRIAGLATTHGWSVWPTPIVWYKPSGGMLGDSAHGPRKAYELILFASKGQKRTRNTAFDVIVASPADSSLHAAAKPVEVYTNLLARSCVAGDVICDPCCGSGTIFVAANKMRLRAIGIEPSANHFGVAQLRMREQQ